MMNDIIVQFARLWGQHEAYSQSAKDEEISDMLKSYDSEEILNVLTEWAKEYETSDIEDTVDFFENKVNILLETNND